MATSSAPVESMAEARGHLAIARTCIDSGYRSGTAEAVDHIAKVLEYVLDWMEHGQVLPAPYGDVEVPK